jgi:UDP-N-acetylmuramoyl-L-alanyl-D-glutamate--2,6-diaminopimelate ligase
MTAAMTLQQLLGAEAGTHGAIAVSGLGLDTRSLAPGDAFVALRGAAAHGITFAPAAVAQGAKVILAEAPAPPALAPVPVPVLWLDGLRERAGQIAARFHGEPSRALQVIGVTGTNGKTSTVQLLAQALTLLGHKAASIGTLGAGLHGEVQAGERTTPDALRVQALLAQFRAAGAGHVAMEVSSHALQQGRVNAVQFACAIFTNLTRDHLDYHGSMQAYGAAKARLFGWPGLAHAVINIDDAFGREIAGSISGGAALLRTSVDNAAAEVHAANLHLDTRGLSFDLRTPWGEAAVTSPLLGRFNVANLLGVIAALGALGFAFEAIVAAVAQLQPVAGRMNRLGGGAQPLVVVDYAHTPDALEQALTTLRAHSHGRLVCVFGCGGERDAGKRPLMAQIAERLADAVIVTDDNPRGEDGDTIVAAIRAGFRDADAVHVQRDRARAIAEGIAQALAGDIVLIAGKGHEPYQEIGAQKFPFDDAVVAQAVLEAGSC